MEKILSSLLQVTLETMIVIVLPILLTSLVKWINAQISSARAQMSREQLVLVETLIKQFVRAAEQSGLTGQVKGLEAKTGKGLWPVRVSMDLRRQPDVV